MSQVEIDRVVAQIRALRQRAVGADSQSVDSLTHATSGSFSSVLKNGLDAVSAAEQTARASAAAFERGAPGVDLASVMIDMQKANVGFRAAVEVRNRVVAAYQDVMNMPI